MPLRRNSGAEQARHCIGRKAKQGRGCYAEHPCPQTHHCTDYHNGGEAKGRAMGVPGGVTAACSTASGRRERSGRGGLMARWLTARGGAAEAAAADAQAAALQSGGAPHGQGGATR